MKGEFTDILTLSIVAKAAITANQFVDADGNVAAADEKGVGIARNKAAIGEVFPVGVVGTFPAIASAAITVGAQLAVAAGGKVKPVVVTTVAIAGSVVGMALEAAAADGDEILVLVR